MATSSKKTAPAEPVEVPDEATPVPEERVSPWPDPPRMWTEEELTHTNEAGVWAPALKEHWSTAQPVEASTEEEVTDNG